MNESRVKGCADYQGVSFPGVLVPDNDGVDTIDHVCQFVRDNKGFIEEFITKHGAVLFRGFPINSVEDYNEFILSFGYEIKEYLGGGGPRIPIIGNILTSTESPAHLVIPFHHEMAYLADYPATLFFWCDVKPGNEGQTPICLSNRVIIRLKEENPNFYNTLKEKGMRYIRTIDDETAEGFSSDNQTSWQHIFDTTDREAAETKAKECGTEIIEWLENGAMKLTTVIFEGFKTDERTGTESW
eukprot:TRINITY_DN312_c0_g1_i2.p1 TRINITY_DN312_c0_g1~~TRINITY_DN312_c0_g1_i2.p1  ORF type:complete len:242 (+),score=53.72 TRINITY_DN312_c0_g1_i2:58-783(+)